MEPTLRQDTPQNAAFIQSFSLSGAHMPNSHIIINYVRQHLSIVSFILILILIVSLKLN